jgi:hypothetical protein
MNNRRRLGGTPASLKTTGCINLNIRAYHFSKLILTFLLFLAVILFTSCKTCKCPAYSNHNDELKNADAITPDDHHDSASVQSPKYHGMAL